MGSTRIVSYLFGLLLAILLNYSVIIAVRRLRKKREETAKTRPDEKRPSEKRKSSLLSLILNFCLTSALTLFSFSLTLGYSFSDIIDIWFGFPDILIYVAVGGGILLAHILTRKPRKRTSQTSPEQEGEE